MPSNIIEILTSLNSLTPTAALIVTSYLWFIIARGHTASAKTAKQISENHLHGLPSMQTTIEKMNDTLQRMDVKNDSNHRVNEKILEILSRPRD